MAKKSSNRIFIILGVVLVVLVLFVVVAKRQGWVGEPNGEQVSTAPVKRVNITEMVSASGKVQPEVEVKISPDVSGEIVELLIKEGDSVKEGQLLLKIRPDNYVSLVDRAVANLNTNRANLSQATAAVAQSEARFAQAKANYERNKSLFEQKVISAADWEQIKTDYEVAQKEVESARQNAQAARYNVSSAQAGVDEAQENLRRTSILAPMSGTVSKLDVELGERVVGTSQMAGTEMLRIANLNNMEVAVDVNENDIIRVQVGDTARIDVDSYSYLDKEFKGIVTSIANTANEALTTDAVTEFEVKVRILNESYEDLAEGIKTVSPFRPGMTASVEIITDRRQDVLSVPLAAVTTRSPNDDKKPGENNEGPNASSNTQETRPGAEPIEVVFVVKDGKAERRPVKTGISDFDNIEILSGLQEGEVVVSGPFRTVSQKLKDGDDVRIEEKKEGSDASPDQVAARQ
ncbi:HlyD family secretion protein [Catalinimonas alkaloidigena]|uniref:HlyD family secretion protein n=1 Tax=Catalinimonas alkaloidigena TaxID=1075417 RepID=A0A1G8XCG0_9BACT|nr:efflux RND transporter periplasmic adaptor subunit [Catalinimonas alkaloidigena]SDJ88054.1 HlyD family secretion protein [Catalinimonas alkaloidigena]